MWEQSDLKDMPTEKYSECARILASYGLILHDTPTLCHTWP